MFYLGRLFLLVFFIFLQKISYSQIPTVQDCLGAIPVCNRVYVETTSPSGSGNYPNEIDGISQGGISCVFNELNSIWYTFTVDNSGEFGFTLTPNDPNDDYDWALFDITNAKCEDIFNDISLQVSCNAAGDVNCQGSTGANGLSNHDVQGGGCDNSPPTQLEGESSNNDLIDVEEGNTYVLMVSNWTGSINGYSIDFGVSGNIGIFDDTAPEVVEIITPEDCMTDGFQVTFSENIQCNSTNGNVFQINGPGGPYTGTLSSTSCDRGVDYDKVYDIIVSPEISEPGNFSISMVTNGVDQILDLCGNAAIPISTPFDFEITLSLDPIDLGDDTLLCQGQNLTLDATTLFADSYNWSDGSSADTLLVSQTGMYTVAVVNECSILNDDIFIEFVDQEVIDVDLGGDKELCRGEEYELDATWRNAISYVWQDGSSGPIYTVNEPGGLFTVNITGVCGETGSAEIDITYDDTELFVDLGTYALLCYDENETLELNARHREANSYEWQDGSTSPYYTVEEPGLYTVILSDECNAVPNVVLVEYTNCDCKFYIPNAFSPDFNGVNDYFKPETTCEVFDYSMKIFNRWGALVFETKDISTGWDGAFKNKPLDPGIYVYLIEYQADEMQKVVKNQFAGDITIIK